MKENSLFSERLLEERKRLGLDQATAGAHGGVSREMWGKYERGKAVMGTNVLMRFATAAGADVLYILTGVRSGAAALLPEEEALVDNYRNCSPDARKLIQAASAAGAQPQITNKAA